MKSAPIVELAHATKVYGDRAVVNDVSLELGMGESLALLGHNGAGKTTLIKLVLGLTRATGGAVRVLGAVPTCRDAVQHRRRIGFLPENVVFHDTMTGRALLGFYAHLKGVTAGACEALLEQVGLTDAADRRIGTYSKGMRQRLGLAQALLGHPKLLVFDEPTSGLDPISRLGFYETVRRLVETGTTVLLSSHALTEIEAQTDRVAIMNEGRIVACGSADALRKSAALPVRIRITLTEGSPAEVALRFGAAVVTQVTDHAIELNCLPEDKMALLRDIAMLDDVVRDIEIQPPTLDALYAHFRGEEVSL